MEDNIFIKILAAVMVVPMLGYGLILEPLTKKFMQEFNPPVNCKNKTADKILRACGSRSGHYRDNCRLLYNMEKMHSKSGDGPESVLRDLYRGDLVIVKDARGGEEDILAAAHSLSAQDQIECDFAVFHPSEQQEAQMKQLKGYKVSENIVHGRKVLFAERIGGH